MTKSRGPVMPEPFADENFILTAVRASSEIETHFESYSHYLRVTALGPNRRWDVG